MRQQWSIFACAFFWLSFPGVSFASNFDYQEIGITLEKTDKKKYIDQAASIGDTFDFNSFGVEGSFYFGHGYYLDARILGSYQARQDTEYYITDTSIGLKKPLAMGTRVDITPEIGFQHALKGICSGGPCQTTIEKSAYLRVESRAWIIPQQIDLRLSFRKTNSFHAHESNISIGYWRSENQRIAIGYSNRSMSKGIRITINYVLQ